MLVGSLVLAVRCVNSAFQSTLKYKIHIRWTD